MAKFNVKVAFSFLLLLSAVHGIAGATKEIIDATTECTSVYAAEPRDTCEGVAAKFKLSPQTFGALNPNINCDKIFVGQWLCIED